MLRTFRYPLLPTPAQEEILSSWLVSCQRLYNGALEHRSGAYKTAKVSITKYGQFKELTELRAVCPEWKAVPVEVLRSSLFRLDNAFKAFFRRCKAGQTPGYPRFRSRDRYDSFSIGRVEPEGSHLNIPKLGSVKFKLYRPLKGDVRDVQVRRSASKWWVCFSCDLGDAPAKQPVRSAIGIDLGLTSFAVLSNGDAVENPRFFREGEALLAARQRKLSRKQRGSNSRHAAKKLVAKAHEHVHNQRLDFSRKLASQLFKHYDLVAHEDLEISRMVRGTFSKSINDAAWGMFLRALNCKAEYAGKTVVAVDPRGTSQRCSRCGDTVQKSLFERQHSCGCGLVLGRDHNAALNVLALGLSAGQLTEGTHPVSG